MYLTVMEGFGANGDAAKFYRLLEAWGNVQLLQLLVRISGKLVCTQLSTLFGQCIQGVTKNQVKENECNM